LILRENPNAAPHPAFFERMNRRRAQLPRFGSAGVPAGI